MQLGAVLALSDLQGGRGRVTRIGTEIRCHEHSNIGGTETG